MKYNTTVISIGAFTLANIASSSAEADFHLGSTKTDHHRSLCQGNKQWSASHRKQGCAELMDWILQCPIKPSSDEDHSILQSNVTYPPCRSSSPREERCSPKEGSHLELTASQLSCWRMKKEQILKSPDRSVSEFGKVKCGPMNGRSTCPTPLKERKHQKCQKYKL